MRKLLLLALLACLAIPAVAQVDLDNGLIVHYAFDGNTQDEIPGNSDVNVQGPQLTQDREGNPNYAYQFDGVDDYMEFAGSLSNVDLPFSFSLWLYRPDPGPGVFTGQKLFASNNNGTNYYGFFMSLNETQTLAISYSDGGISGSGSRRSIESIEVLPVEEWVHVVSVLESWTEMTMYFNGVPIRAEIHGGGDETMVSADLPSRIGIYDLGVGGNPWEGAMDDIRVYNRALNAEEALALYNLPPGEGETDHSVMISEIMNNPEDVADSAGEWFELFNTTNEPVDLSGWKIEDLSGESHTIGESLIIDPLGTLVLCKNEERDLNGDVGCDYRYTTMLLGNKADAIILVDDMGEERDRVIYDDGITFPDPEGASFFFTGDPSEDNNDGALWQTSFERAGNYANVDCPLCDDFGSPGAVDGAWLPVEMVAFSVVGDNEQAFLRWETASETNNAGFEIYHRLGARSFQKIGWVQGAGTTDIPQHYAFRTKRLQPGHHSFKIKQVDFDGQFAWSEVVLHQMDMDQPFLIHKPYPNPFNPTTTLSFSVQQDQQVRVELYDAISRRIATPFNQHVSANTMQHVSINGRGLASGRYLVLVIGASFVESYQVYLVK